MYAEDVLETLDRKVYPCPECRGRGYTLTPDCPADPQMPSTKGHEHNRYRDMGGLVRCTAACMSCTPWEPGVAHAEQLAAEREDKQRKAEEGEDWWPSNWHLAEHQVLGVLFEVKRKNRIRPIITMDDWRVMARASRPGQVTTDEPVTGLLEDRWVTVPAYLVGTPVEYDEFRLTVRYEFMGSFVDVAYMPSAQQAFRFSHPWDDDFGTRAIMGG